MTQDNKSKSFFDEAKEGEEIIITIRPTRCVDGPQKPIILSVLKNNNVFITSNKWPIDGIKTLDSSIIDYLKQIEFSGEQFSFCTSYTDFEFQYNNQKKEYRIDGAFDINELLFGKP